MPLDDSLRPKYNHQLQEKSSMGYFAPPSLMASSKVDSDLILVNNRVNAQFSISCHIREHFSIQLKDPLLLIA